MSDEKLLPLIESPLKEIDPHIKKEWLAPNAEKNMLLYQEKQLPIIEISILFTFVIIVTSLYLLRQKIVCFFSKSSEQRIVEKLRRDITAGNIKELDQGLKQLLGCSEMTSKESLEYLRKKNFKSEDLDHLKFIFEQAELVKFAGLTLPADQKEKMCMNTQFFLNKLSS